MTPSQHLEYFKRREMISRTAASAASSDVVRDVHLHLAERYADKVWSIQEGYDPCAGEWQSAS